MRHMLSSNTVNAFRGGRVRQSLLPVLFVAVLALSATPKAASALSIVPTFNSNLSAAAQAVINNAIGFYQNTFRDPITVDIEFHNMTSGLGSSFFVFYNLNYLSYRTALAADATSPDDISALSGLPAGPSNPVNGSSGIAVKSANGRAVGLNTPEVLLNFANSPCPTYTGAGCIGLNVSNTTTGGGFFSLFATVEHEIDEILGLGSALNGTTAPTNPMPEDLFRYASPGVRSYATNSSTTNPCASGTPLAFFSIDGATALDQFNNCSNGGDYGDWITHTPSQVQDAFTNGTGSPSLNLNSPETRALDVTGYTRAVVPEPLGLLLFGTGLTVVLTMRRRALRDNRK